jgi:hypothetical protein
VWPNRHSGRVEIFSARVHLVEDVRVLVERRAVADFNRVVHDVRAFGQRAEPIAVFRGQNVQGPFGRAPGDGVEALGLLEPARDLVVIAAHDRDRFELLHALDHHVRIRAVADEVAEHECLVEGPGAGVREAGVECLEVRVDVGQHEITHQCSSQSMSCSTRASTPTHTAASRTYASS